LFAAGATASKLSAVATSSQLLLLLLLLLPWVMLAARLRCMVAALVRQRQRGVVGEAVVVLASPALLSAGTRVRGA